MESWTDHLREAIRLSDDDKRLLAAVAVFQHDAHRPSRYLAVDPHEYLHTHSTSPAKERLSFGDVSARPALGDPPKQ